MSKSNNSNIILIDKFGKMKTLQVNTKDFNKEDLYKKCGFKKDNDFSKQIEWKITVEKQKYKISVYAKTDGRANTENKYDFPPPIDNVLFFGTCAVISEIKDLETNSYKLFNLSIELWEKIYEKLFGGFENLNDTIHEDENEVDELANVKADKKTKQGYLKDGFVVDDMDNDDDDDDEEDADDYENIDDIEYEDDNIEEDGDEDDDDDDITKDIEENDEDDYEDETIEEDDIDNSDEDDEGVNKKRGRKPKKNGKKKSGNLNVKVSIVKKSKKGKKPNDDIIEDLIIEDITTELSEEEYVYA
uniref:Uncharacterized protein n=1 Tax=viral metagenome TaxID=1070528 RepID=A0A6C0E2D6_9ZZZZ